MKKDPHRYAVTSDEGFRVDRVGSPMTQFVLRYSEGDHILEYPLENMVPGSVTQIIVSDLRDWLPPFAGEQISEERRRQIAERLVQALKFLGDGAELT